MSQQDLIQLNIDGVVESDDIYIYTTWHAHCILKIQRSFRRRKEERLKKQSILKNKSAEEEEEKKSQMDLRSDSEIICGFDSNEG